MSLDDLLKDFKTPIFPRLLAYWDARRAGRAMPARRDIDPLDFKYALGHVMLLDVLRDPLRFRFRIHGSLLSRRAGYDMTGKFADDLPNEANRHVLLARCRDIVASRAPRSSRSERPLGDRVVGYEALWMPLSDDGVEVSMLLGALGYLDPPSGGRSAARS